MLTTDQKGAIAEHAIIGEALRLGVDVYTPCFEGGRYDLIFGVGALVPISRIDGRPTVHLRVAPTKNNQVRA